VSERRNLLSYLDELPAHGTRPLYLWRDGVRWRRRSYAEVHDRALACAGMLAGAGVGPGDRVMLQGPEAADWTEALHAILRLGAVAVPLSPETPAEFLDKVSRKTGARTLIAPPSVAPPPGVGRIALGRWPDRPESEPPRADPRRSDHAEIMFTSGTTGEPRGVVLTHGNLVSDLAPIEKGFLRWKPWARLMGTMPLLTTVPLSHMFGQVLSTFLVPHMGLTAVITPPRPHEVIDAARRHKAWGLVTVPRVMELLASELRRRARRDGGPERFEERLERFRGRHFVRQSVAFRDVQRQLGIRFRFLVVGGAALPPDLLGFYEGIGYLVVQGYGLTETAPVVALSNPFSRGSSAVGRPLHGQEVRIGEDGEVLVRGENVSPGYLGEEAVPAPDGWFRTGDLGVIDEEGRLHIKGRAKDVIVTAEGENVHASDVEMALSRTAGVRDACVIGLPADGSDQVHAVLLLSAGGDGARIVRETNERLEPRQRIRSFTLWPEEDLPRTHTGKVRKKIVLEAIQAMQQGASAREAVGAAAVDLRSLIARVAKVERDRIESGTKLQEDLGLKSLDLVELIAAAEDELGVTFPEEGIDAVTFGDLERLAGRPVAAGSGSAQPSGPAGGGGSRPGAALPAAVEPRDTGEKSGDGSGWRGSLAMPRWAASLPVRLLRRLVDELVLIPLVRLYTRTRIEGREHLAGLEPPFLLLSNHHSYLDTMLVKLCLPFGLRERMAPAMTTRYLRCAFGEVPGPFARYAKETFQALLVELLFHAWPLPETAGFRRSLSYSGELADRGFVPLIFAEGRHVPEGEIHDFRGGIGLFVRELRCPVVPVYLEGTARVVPDGSRWLHFGRTRLVFGAPFTVEAGISGDEATRRAEAAVRALAQKGATVPPSRS